MQKTFIFLALISGLSQLSFCANSQTLADEASDELTELTPPTSPERRSTITTHHTESDHPKERPASASPRVGSQLARVPVPRATGHGSFLELQAKAEKHRQVTEERKQAAAATAQACALIEQISALLNDDPEFDGIVYINKEIRKKDRSIRTVQQNKAQELKAILEGNISHANQKSREEALKILKAALERRNTRYLSDLKELIQESQSGTVTCFSQDDIKQLEKDLSTIDANPLSNKLQDLHAHFNTDYVRTVKTSPLKRSASTPLSIPSPTNSSGRSSAVSRSNSVLQFADPKLLERERIIPITPLADLENSTVLGSLFANPHFKTKAFEYFSSLNPEVDKDLYKVKTDLTAELTEDEKIDVLEAVLAKKEFHTEFTSCKNKIERRAEEANQKIDLIKTILFNCGTKFKKSSL